MDRDGASSSIEDFAHAFSCLPPPFLSLISPSRFPSLPLLLSQGARKKVSDSPHDEGKNGRAIHSLQPEQFSNVTRKTKMKQRQRTELVEMLSADEEKGNHLCFCVVRISVSMLFESF